MKAQHWHRFCTFRRLCLLCSLILGLGVVAGEWVRPSPAHSAQKTQSQEFVTTYDYVVQFYPLWFT
jgi:hypothetical protein